MKSAAIVNHWAVGAVSICLIAAPLVAFAGEHRDSNPASIVGPILQIHNAERARVGSAPLIWDPALAFQAQAYAWKIAPLGRLVHSSKAERGRTGENLAMAFSGSTSVAALVRLWANERNRYRRGVFPNNSVTGNWADVGHYTAMIWPTTDRIGCGVAVAGASEVLVCRYSPGGNIDGKRLP